MRYYLSNFTNPHVTPNTSLIETNKTMQFILTHSGIIHLIGDKMYDYKLLIQPDVQNINNYIDDHDLIMAGYTMIKKSQVMQIPIHCKVMVINQKQYKLHEKSKTNFIIEKMGGRIQDFYFESSYDYDNKFLKKDILSFLSHFK